MKNNNSLFIEATTDNGYKILWEDGTPQEAMSFITTYKTPHRLELWSKAHANTDKGFCPMALREENSMKVMVSNTFKMLYLN